MKPRGDFKCCGEMVGKVQRCVDMPVAVQEKDDNY